MIRTLAKWAAGLILAAIVAIAPSAWAAESEILQAVVGIAASIPSDARSAESLGTERIGSGVVIDDEGLVLTIGYLVQEASEIAVTAMDGKRSSAKLVAYDFDTGFALLRIVSKLNIRPMRLGDSGQLGDQDSVLAISAGGERPVTAAIVVSRRPFAGYWEYMLDQAIFTAPPHPSHSGAALIGEDGRLLGIGSLFVGDAVAPRVPVPGNMFVPVNDLKPILADLLDKGRRTTPARPWIGVNTQDVSGRVMVTRVTPGSPAAKAGLAPGDLILGVGGKPVAGLVEFYRALWTRGPAGATVPLNVLPKDASDFIVREKPVKTMDRGEWLKTGRSY